MKSAIALLKLVAFLLALQWLCSCNGKHTLVKLIYAYKDSIGIAKRSLLCIKFKEDSIRNIYNKQYLATGFPLTREGEHQRIKWVTEERKAFHEMLLILTAYRQSVSRQQTQLELDCIRYNNIIDSLKLELQ